VLAKCTFRSYDSYHMKKKMHNSMRPETHKKIKSNKLTRALKAYPSSVKNKLLNI